MANPTTNPVGTATRQSVWTVWIAIAGIAVVLGLLAPLFLPGDSARDSPRTRSEMKDLAKGEYVGPALPDVPNPQGMFARLGLGTLFVLGLCVATLFGMKRWINPAMPGNPGKREMRLEETLVLGNRCSLHLVQLGKHSVLVGVDASGLKSMIPLVSPFEDLLAGTDAMPPSDAKLTIPAPCTTGGGRAA